MDQRAGTPMSSRTASLVHTMLVAGVAVVVVMLAVVRIAYGGATLEGEASVFRIVGAAVLLGGIVAIQAFRRSIPPRRTDEDLEAWWGAYGVRAVIVWAQADGLAMIGAVFWFLTGDVLFIALVLYGLLTLAFSRPGRLVV
jgi:hypothetical protein